MKYCCTKKRKSFHLLKKTKIGIIMLLCGILMILIVADSVVRSVIQGYPMNFAAGVVTEMMDKAMDNVLKNTDNLSNSVDEVIYSNEGKVISVETDTVKLTKIKTEFSKEFSNLIKEHGDIIKVSVPIGTLIGNEYTIGRGPKISFDLQFTWTVNSEFKSVFYEAGVNNTLHSIELKVNNYIYIIIPWGHSSKTVSTKYIVAETVIVGEVPEAFTNINGANDEIVDDVVDHGAKLE
ncbi:MAG: sporulation protein YunB [Acutalibacteraceae bacterium]|nr:sporulation protein YunB [Acutalibacteraceae bacterium]